MSVACNHPAFSVLFSENQNMGNLINQPHRPIDEYVITVKFNYGKINDYRLSKIATSVIILQLTYCLCLYITVSKRVINQHKPQV